MVITSWSCWLKTQQARLNTLVNIEPAETLFDGQFSTSANSARAINPRDAPPAAWILIGLIRWDLCQGFEQLRQLRVHAPIGLKLEVRMIDNVFGCRPYAKQTSSRAFARRPLAANCGRSIASLSPYGIRLWSGLDLGAHQQSITARDHRVLWRWSRLRW